MMLLAAILALQDPPRAEEALLVRAGWVITGDGREIQNGSVLIVGGKIRALGETVEAPAGAKILDAAGKVVMPGLVDANSPLGTGGPRNEDGREVTPEVRLLDTLEPGSPELRRALQAGVTTLYVGPGNRNVVGGLGAVVRTAGRTRAEMIVVEEAALKAAMGSGPAAGNYPPRGSQPTFYARRPTTRMGVVWELRKALIDAKRDGPDDSPLRRALAGRLQLRVSASRATDIEEALRIAAEFGLSIVIEEGQEAHKVAAELARRKIPVLLRPVPSTGLDGADGSEGAPDALARLREAGVRVALLPPADGGAAALLAAAAMAVKHGASRDDALRAVTSAAADIAGAGARAGSLSEGKDADLLILSGDPLEVTSRVETVLVGGRVVFGTRAEAK